MKFIKKILASLIVAATTMGTMSAAVSANPPRNKKRLIHMMSTTSAKNNMYDSDEQIELLDISQFYSLIEKSVWNENDVDEFIKICMKFSYGNVIGECSLDYKLEVTNQLINCLCDDEYKMPIAVIFLNFSYYNFFKEYDTKQKLYITDAIIDCSSQKEAIPYVVEAFSNLCLDDFFKEYSADQKAKIAKTLVGCLNKEEFSNNIITPLAKILKAPDVLKKLTKDEQDRCASIME